MVRPCAGSPAFICRGPSFRRHRVSLYVPLPRDSFCSLLFIIRAPNSDVEAGDVLSGYCSGELGGQCLRGAWEALVGAARSGAGSVTPSLLRALTLVMGLLLPSDLPGPTAEGRSLAWLCYG